MLKNDVQVLRELAKQTAEEAARGVHNERRSLWRDFNSLRTTRVPVYILDPQGMWREVFSEKELKCEDALFRVYENWMRLQLYHATFGDDYIIEPWVTVRPVYQSPRPDWQTWGVHMDIERIKDTLAYHLGEAPVKTPGDIAKLAPPFPIIDKEKSEADFEKIQDAIGGVIGVIPDNFPPGAVGLSYTLAWMLEPEQMLYQLHDRPEMVHQLSKMITDNSMKICLDADEKGLFSNCDHTFHANPLIQAMPYCHELPEPGERRIVPMSQHWIYACSQEFECVGPEMYEEFVLSYERPIYEKFGLTSYGCCENLTKKIPYLKKIKNLRRVAVTPWADDEECAEQLGRDYVVSWRPNPAEMVMQGFDEDRIKTVVKRAKRIYESRGCHWEINLKDFISVERDRDRLRKWVEIVRSVVD